MMVLQGYGHKNVFMTWAVKGEACTIWFTFLQLGGVAGLEKNTEEKKQHVCFVRNFLYESVKQYRYVIRSYKHITSCGYISVLRQMKPIALISVIQFTGLSLKSCSELTITRTWEFR